ncbi:hypothetical protein [Hymenobacter daecheongensis]|uniref:hypothetical protein n=1 Tax=Hymenobacter daecheongensis TaxID=496053 RepID=UPI000933B227|nr:hypothetical protein [Hymenobacter daecheongensis]
MIQSNTTKPAVFRRFAEQQPALCEQGIFLGEAVLGRGELEVNAHQKNTPHTSQYAGCFLSERL